MGEALLRKPYVREAKFWSPVAGKPAYVRCDLCSRRCAIAPGMFGACGVRRNVGGRMYTYVYGLLTAANLDPIEKKPLSTSTRAAPSSRYRPPAATSSASSA
jgi:pyruvate formate lyase activating enzyme